MADFRSLRRKLVQLAAAAVYNADISNWFKGTVSRSPLKKVCVPGLNCYSCPAAVSSCPLGALQNTIGNGRLPFFVTGFLMLTGTLLGRAVCGFLCPAGLFQEILYRIKAPKFKKTAASLKITRKISVLKYFILFIMCIFLPAIYYLRLGAGSPFFCKFICPAGTAEAGIPLVVADVFLRQSLGVLFTWKTALLAVFIIWSVFFFRPFCRFFCPLGAIYSFFNKTVVFGIKVDEAKCVGCGVCTASCKMDTLKINDRECIRCGGCCNTCRYGAINPNFFHKKS